MALLIICSKEIDELKISLNDAKLRFELAENKFMRSVSQLEHTKQELLQKLKFKNFEISKRDKQIIYLSKTITEDKNEENMLECTSEEDEDPQVSKVRSQSENFMNLSRFILNEEGKVGSESSSNAVRTFKVNASFPQMDESEGEGKDNQFEFDYGI